MKGRHKQRYTTNYDGIKNVTVLCSTSNDDNVQPNNISFYLAILKTDRKKQSPVCNISFALNCRINRALLCVTQLRRVYVTVIGSSVFAGLAIMSNRQTTRVTTSRGLSP